MQLASRFGRHSPVLRSREPLSDDQMRAVAPSNFAEAAHDSRSERYTYTEWHRVVFWEALAERVERHVAKGSSIFVGGRLQSNSWTDKDGVKRYGVDIVADQMQLLGGKRETSGDGGASLPSTPPERKEGDAGDESPF